MIDILSGLTDLETMFLLLVGFVLMFLGFRMGTFLSSQKHKKEKQALELESHNIHKGLKKILEEEKNQLVAERDELKEKNQIHSNKLEDYRKKLAGMGMLNFSGNKKRADILYSLLLENEALEQLLSEQGEKLASERQDFLKQRLQDIKKRQRLMAEIFNDDTIKNYVRDILSDEERMNAATQKIEEDESGNLLPGGSDDTNALPAPSSKPEQ